MIGLRRLGQRLAPLARAYSAVLLCESPWLGGWFFAITWWSPSAALAGTIALLAAAVWERLLTLSDTGQPHLLNSMLVGLYLGAFHQLDGALLAWLTIAALATTLLTHWLADMLGRWGRLPVLSLPFVLVSWMVIITAQGPTPAALLPASLPPATGLFTPAIDNFFISLGWLMLVPYPQAGALLFAGLLVASRYLALLAVAGYLVGHGVLLLFGRHDGYAIGFNFMLTAMALGGIFTIPGRSSFLLALAGSALAAWLVAAQGALLGLFYLPPLTLPFIFAVYLWLGGLRGRLSAAPPYLTDPPAAPEVSAERLRLARARGGDSNLPALIPPFYGEWRVSQAFDGPHTHRGEWRHALDFHIVTGDSSFRGNGYNQSDYFCFGAPLLAPISGQVVRLRDDLADVAPGEVDLVNNWGNYLLLRSVFGYYVLLAHLKQGSMQVHVGAWVEAGQPIAACGSSGRSPEPHLHMHVQDQEWLGSPTRPFQLTNLLVRRDNSNDFHFYYQPSTGERLAAAPRHAPLFNALRLLPGHILNYRLFSPDSPQGELRQLRSELTLLGQSRLIAAENISAAFVETEAVIGYYDRQGKSDTMLDLWLLALGLTPFSMAAERWNDRPALRLLPIGPIRHLLTTLLMPLGSAASSRYRRCWDDTTQAWLQQGEHHVRLAPGIEWCAETQAWIVPGHGVTRLRLEMFGKSWEARLESPSQPAIEAVHS